ncbi:MAG: MFS transporter [Clostridiales bacterium]|nr:MFS transporter [Clostridiales bacterium]
MAIDSKLSKVPHMHWITVLALFFALAAIWGSTGNSAGIFITPIQETLNATRPQMVIATTLKGLGSIGGAFICAFLLKRMPVMQVIRLAALLLTASVFAMSYIHNLIHYYLIVMVQAALTSTGTYIPMSIVVQNWFEKKTSMATGFAFMGSGLGGMVYNYLGGIWIPTVGWRRTLFLFGIITLVSLFLTLFVITRATPYHLNLRPFGASDKFESEQLEKELTGLEVKEAFRSIKFCVFISANFLITLSTNALFNNMSPHLIDIGYSLPQAAQVSAFFMLFLMLGKPVLGYAFEFLGLKIASVISTLAITLALTSAIFADNAYFLLPLTVGSGLGLSFSSIAYPAFSKHLFGQKNYAVFASILQISAGLATLLGPITTSLLYSYSKNYISTFILALIYTALTILIWLFVLPKRGHEPF